MKPVPVSHRGSVSPFEAAKAGRESFVSRLQTLCDLALRSRMKISELVTRFKELADSFHLPRILRPRLWKLFAAGALAMACGGDSGNNPADDMDPGNPAPDGGADVFRPTEDGPDADADTDAGIPPSACTKEDDDGFLALGLVNPKAKKPARIVIPYNETFPEYEGDTVTAEPDTFGRAACIKVAVGQSTGPAPGESRWITAQGLEVFAVPDPPDP
ncbi:MAG: hypothetical protein V1908_01305, partial [Candidatus Peregrinibacteria bacterium]